MLTPWKESYHQPRQHIKKQRHYFADKVCLVKVMVFPVVMYGCESWTIKKAERRRIDAFEVWYFRRFLRDSHQIQMSVPPEIQPVHPKGDQSWVFIEGSDVEAETPIIWPPHAKNWLIGKDPDAGKDWGQEEKWMTEDEMIGWHHPLNGQEFGWAPGVGVGQGGLACCSSWCRRVGDDWVTELRM